MKKIIVYSSIVLSMIFAFGYFHSSEDYVGEFIEIIKLKEMLQHRKEIQKQAALSRVDNMLDQMKTSFPDVADSMLILMKSPMHNYVETIINSWETDEIVEIYSNTLKNTLGEDRLKNAVEYYKTEKGKNELIAFNKAQNEINLHIQNKIAIASEEATQKITIELKNIIEEQTKKQLKWHNFQ